MTCLSNPSRFLLALMAGTFSGIACQEGGSGLGGSEDGDDGSSGGPPAMTGSSDDAILLECTPGEVRCMSQAFIETCAPTGLEWVAEPCPANNTCIVCDEDNGCAEDHCAGPCDTNTLVPSSAGCSFIANRQIHQADDAQDTPDSIIVANPNEDLPAQVKLWRTPEGKRVEELVEELELAPGEDALFSMTQDFVLGSSTMFRTGGTYRVASDIPVVAYQHSPGANYSGNDSSLLLPDNVVGQDYVVVSYNPHEQQGSGQGKGKPSFFEVVALEDNTLVEWTPPVPTAGNGLPIDPVVADATGSQIMNRFDTMRIAASESYPDEFPGDTQDISGTVIHSDKPIWVVGGSRCSRVPVRDDNLPAFCDPLQEVLVPLKYWGQSYVAPHPPERNDITTDDPPFPGPPAHWRLYSASEMVRVSSTPPVFDATNCTAPNTLDGEDCVLFTRGSWVEVETPGDVNVYFEADGAFMPVGYLQSRWSTQEPTTEAYTLWGDPAMYQTVPTEQFLSRYVVQTAVGFPHNYIQVIRPLGGSNVIVGPEVVTDWEPIGDFEVATVEVPEGTHTVFSNDDVPFGILQMGYTEDRDTHYPQCTRIPEPLGLETCPRHANETDCEMDDNNCVWYESACEAKRQCQSSYAYPGGLNSDPVFIP